ncbi:MAG TPA: ABC transporter permease [Herbaspirillum sp.]
MKWQVKFNCEDDMRQPEISLERRPALSYFRFLEDACRNISSNPERSLLALLGIVIGTACVIAVVNVGQNAAEESISQFKAMGIDIVVAQGVRTNVGSLPPMPLADALALPSLLRFVKSSAPLVITSGDVTFKRKKTYAGIAGATSSLYETARLLMRDGRFVSDFDQHQTFAILGAGVTRTFNKDGIHIQLGDSIRIDNYFFTIIGFLEDMIPNPLIPLEFNNTIIIPLESMRRISPSTNISNVIVRLKENAEPIASAENIRTYFTSKSAGTSIQVQSARQLIESMQSQHRLLTYLLAGMGGLSLLVGGIGVMNVMLTGVMERRSEIGLRMAIGARKRDILMIFLMEASVLSVAGGIIGIFLGFTAAYLIALMSGWQFQLAITALPVGIGMSMAIGLVSGIYPAITAARLHPIVALRAE